MDPSKIIHWRALATRVLAVAVSRYEFEGEGWTAYVDAVPGQSHRLEALRAAEEGDKLSEELARVIFAEFKDKPYVE